MNIRAGFHTQVIAPPERGEQMYQCVRSSRLRRDPAGGGMMRLVIVSAVWLLILNGCAGPSAYARLASGQEAMCKHCNCLMPAGTDPEHTCPACDCGYVARQCVRGH